MRNVPAGAKGGDACRFNRAFWAQSMVNRDSQNPTGTGPVGQIEKRHRIAPARDGDGDPLSGIFAENPRKNVKQGGVGPCCH